MKKPFYLIPVLATVLVGCSEQRQDLYQTKEDCLQEWQENQCEEHDDLDESGAVVASHYYGPQYFWNSGTINRSAMSGFHGTSTTTATHVGVPSESISRGGFGSIGSSHASSAGE